MKGLLEKVKLNARALKIAGGSLATTALTTMSFAYASGAGAGGAGGGAATGTAQELVKNLLAYVFAIFKYIGWLLLAWGIGQLVLAFKNEDADSKSRAMMLIVVAIILTVLPAIFNGVMGSTIGSISTSATL